MAVQESGRRRSRGRATAVVVITKASPTVIIVHASNVAQCWRALGVIPDQRSDRADRMNSLGAFRPSGDMNCQTNRTCDLNRRTWSTSTCCSRRPSASYRTSDRTGRTDQTYRVAFQQNGDANPQLPDKPDVRSQSTNPVNKYMLFSRILSVIPDLRSNQASELTTSII